MSLLFFLFFPLRFSDLCCPLRLARCPPLLSLPPFSAASFGARSWEVRFINRFSSPLMWTFLPFYFDQQFVSLNPLSSFFPLSPASSICCKEKPGFPSSINFSPLVFLKLWFATPFFPSSRGALPQYHLTSLLLTWFGGHFPPRHLSFFFALGVLFPPRVFC